MTTTRQQKVSRLLHKELGEYFQRQGTKVLLKAANRHYPPFIPRYELEIAGVIIANIRKYR